jgi:hypothetical protein
MGDEARIGVLRRRDRGMKRHSFQYYLRFSAKSYTSLERKILLAERGRF